MGVELTGVMGVVCKAASDYGMDRGSLTLRSSSWTELGPATPFRVVARPSTWTEHKHLAFGRCDSLFPTHPTKSYAAKVKSDSAYKGYQTEFVTSAIRFRDMQSTKSA